MTLEDVSNPQYKPFVRIDFKLDGLHGYSVHNPETGKIVKFKYHDPFDGLSQEIKILKARLVGKVNKVAPTILKEIW